MEVDTMNRIKNNTIYHVCKNWDGCNLKSLYKQYGNQAYDIFLEKWPDAGELAEYHIHYIHCHFTLDEAKEHQAEHGGQIIAIDVEYLEVVIDNLEYPHPMIYGEITIDDILVT